MGWLIQLLFGYDEFQEWNVCIYGIQLEYVFFVFIWVDQFDWLCVFVGVDVFVVYNVGFDFNVLWWVLEVIGQFCLFYCLLCSFQVVCKIYEFEFYCFLIVVVVVGFVEFFYYDVFVDVCVCVQIIIDVVG